MKLVFGLLLWVGCDAEEPRSSLYCDIRERACRASIMAQVIELRGGKAVELPETQVLTQAELDERLKSAEEEGAEQSPDAELAYRGYALFGLVPPNYQPEQGRAQQLREIAGVYFPKDDQIVLVDRGEPLDSNSAITTFAHELVHALQYRDHDLDELETRVAGSRDAWLALRALTEGEATLYEVLMLAKLAGRQPSDIDWGRFLSEFQYHQLNTALMDTAPLVMAALRFPYGFGAGYVTRRWLKDGHKGIDRLYEEPPSSTHQVLFDESDRDLTAEQDEISARAIPELDGKQLRTLNLGAWQRALFFAREALVGQPLWYARDTLADVFSIWHDEEHDLVSASWRVRFAPDTQTKNWLGVDDWYVGSLDAEEPREAFLIASEGELPTDLKSISWRPARASVEDGTPAPNMRACAIEQRELIYIDSRESSSTR
ncbi:MAG TPA: hypothetical protein VFN67_18835 [Polyangiales bacterium]|nr:hypothetical protein [Polyangiales bacterium]